MSVSNLLHPNDYELFADAFHASEIDANADGTLNIGMDNETTRINIGQGPGSPTPLYLNGVLHNPTPGPVLSIGPINGSSTANGMTFSASVLALSPADATNGGVITAIAQSFAGIKTFVNNIVGQANLVMPACTGLTTGVIFLGAQTRIHNYTLGANSNFFAGNTAGGFTGMTAASVDNTGIGMNACVALTSGARNTIYGSNNAAALTTSSNNTVMGYNNAPLLSTGTGSGTFIGTSNCASMTNCNQDVVIGSNCAASYASGGNRNVVMGSDNNLGNGTARNVIIGTGNLGNTGQNNIILGQSNAIVDGSNIIIGFGNALPGDNNQIRIGWGSITNCQIAGIYGNAPGSPQVVIIDSNGNMGSSAIGSISGVTTLAAVGAVPNANAGTIAGNTLNLEPASASFPGVITTGSQTFAGLKTFNNGITIPAGAAIVGVAGTTMLWQGSAGVSSDIFVGRSSGAAAIAGSARNCGLGQNALLSKTTGADNTALGFGSLASILTGGNNIAIGSGAASTYTGTESNCICIGNAGVIADSARIRIGTVGTQTACQIAGIYGNSPASAQVVIVDSNGNLGSAAIASVSGVTTMTAVGAAPNANAATISGNNLTLEPADATNPGLVTTASQPFAGMKTFNTGLALTATSKMTMPLQSFIENNNSKPIFWQGAFGDDTSIFVGANSGIAAAAGTSFNTGLGFETLLNVTGGHHNIAVGSDALGFCNNGHHNTAVGSNALFNVLTGNGNIGIGTLAGSNYTGAESGNIIIGESVAGTVGESNVIRIGDPATATECYVAGIFGVTSAGASTAVINAAGLLGTIVSSQRYKNSITPVSTNRVLDLECMSFKYNSDKTGAVNYGFIAEDVKEIIPEVVIYEEMRDPDGTILYDSDMNIRYTDVPKTIRYEILWPLLQDSVKKMSERLDKQEKIIAQQQLALETLMEYFSK